MSGEKRDRLQEAEAVKAEAEAEAAVVRFVFFLLGEWLLTNQD